MNQFGAVQTQRKDPIVQQYSGTHNLVNGGDHAHALYVFDQASTKFCESIDKAIDANPDDEKIIALWKSTNITRRQLGLPYIFPAGLGKAQMVDGISGFLSKEDLEALRYCAVNSKGKSVNIGVFDGLSTYFIGKNNPNLEVYGIDAYLGMNAQNTRIDHEHALKAKQNLTKLENTHLIVGLSSDIAQSWRDEIGFLFIDGNHSADAAVTDFTEWSPFVSADGLIAVHDAYRKVSKTIYKIRQKDNSHGPDIICQKMESDPNYEFVKVSGCTEVWRKRSRAISAKPGDNNSSFVSVENFEGSQGNKQEPKMNKMDVAKYCPETCIVFVSYGRHEIAARSYNSLVSAIEPYRDRVKVIISDATDDERKMTWARNTNADDVILTPKFTPAATSRNLATTLILNKYSPKYLCMVEDDFEYDAEWYPSLVEAATRLYGVVSPLDLAYGIFSACDHQIPPERRKEDQKNNVTAYIFGAVAYQRFVPTSHYLAVMRGWDADLLGISYAQTGGQTFRNVMRGFCGAILHGRLSWPIDVDKNLSTWQARRSPGPPAHSFNLRDYDVIAEKTREAGVYQRNEK
jgi:hypothetical protein